MEKKEKSKWEKAQKKSCYHFYSPLIQRYLHKHFILKEKKTQDISIGLILGEVMRMFVETTTWTNFEINSNSSDLIWRNLEEIAIPATSLARKAFFATLRLYLS